MTKEQAEHTVIGLNKSTIAMIVGVFAIIAALMFWKDRGSTEASAAASVYQSIQSNTHRNDNQDEVIAATQSEVKEIRDEQHKAELARTEMTGDIKATRSDVKDIKDDFKDVKQYLMQYDFGKKEPE